MIRFLKRCLGRPLADAAVAKEVARLLAQRKVLAGTFEGMPYIDRALCSSLSPKLLGVYEREIAAALNNGLQGADGFIDIGAAEGYYAVGVAWKFQLPVIAFEASEHGPLLALAALNQVSDRIELHGLCDLGKLAAALARFKAPLVLCDIEGAESILLDPRYIPALTSVRIIVEVHDMFTPGCGKLLESRFQTTHHIETIRARPRTRDDVWFATPQIPLVDTRMLATPHLDEKRPHGMYWLVMEPKHGH